MTVRHQFIIGLKWSALGKIVSQIISWAITIVVIRLLAPSDYGLMAMAMMVITLLTHLNEFGLGSALIQAKEINDDQCGAIFSVMLLLSGTLSAALALTAPILAWFFEEPRLALLLSVAGLGFLISALSTIPESLLRREMNFKVLAGADTLNILCASLLTLTMAWHDFGVWALIVGNLFGACIKTAVLNIVSPRKIAPNFRLRQCQSQLGFGGYLTASRFAWWFMSQADVLIGAKLLGKEALGLYSVALNLASIPMHKSMAVINQVAFSAGAKLQDQKEATRNGLLEGLRWLGYAVFPTVAGMVVVAQEFVPLVLGKNWSGAILPFQLISIAIPLRMVSSVLSTSTTAMGRADIDFRNTLTGMFVMPICFIAGAQWGPAGLAASWLFAVPVTFSINFARTAAVTDLTAKDLLKVFASPLIATFLMGICVYVARDYISIYTNGFPLIAAIILTGMATYPIILLAIDTGFRTRLTNLFFSK